MSSMRLILSVWLLLHDRATDHPGFRYQPRKPSEKKKRMTKNKLAKLAAKSNSTDTTTDATILPAQSDANNQISEIEAQLRCLRDA